MYHSLSYKVVINVAIIIIIIIKHAYLLSFLPI
jgi:hypothetical protein